VFKLDYESLVGQAARGMSDRDDRPMPASVTTPEAFYRVMARAALDAIDLRTLLDRLERTEREQKRIEGSLKRIEKSLRHESKAWTQPTAANGDRGAAGSEVTSPSFVAAGGGEVQPLNPHPWLGTWRRRILP
jgi:hypothetical protein